MRRFAGWLFVATLCALPATAQASLPLGSTPDIPTSFMLRLFGEVSDARSTLMSNGYTGRSDTPLRDAAFVVSINTSSAPVRSPEHPTVTGVPRVVPLAAIVAQPQYVAPRSVRLNVSAPAPLPLTSVATVPYEADPSSALSGDAESSAFSFGSTGSSAAGFAFSVQSAPQEPTDSDGQSAQLPLALRVGNVHVLAHFNAGLDTTPSTGIDDTLPEYVPTYAGVSRSSLGANLAVPIAPRLLFGVGYTTEHLVTGYGMPSSLEGLDGRNDTYSGNVTFLFPRLSSALSLSAQQYRYQDNVLPAEFTQLRENLNLTVKF